MNQTEMLHHMCHTVLSQADIKAICKNRGLPAQAVTSRSVLESLFVSDTGLAAVFALLAPNEVALLHLLAAIDKPVDVTFFGCFDRERIRKLPYGTISQLYNRAFAEVKERLVRRGILLQTLTYEPWSKKSQMERWRFALPVQFAPHLPPLIESAKRLAGPGDCHGDLAREKLKAAASRSAAAQAGGEQLEIAGRELRLAGEPFLASRLLAWQHRGWQQETAPAKSAKDLQPYALSPAEAVLRILGSLDADCWAEAASLAEPLAVFTGTRVDSPAVCESGWRWGCLARQLAEGTTWYRVATQPSAADVPAHRYLDVASDGAVTVDPEVVPFESLEHLVSISDQRPEPSGKPVLLLAPNLIKMGRVAQRLDALPEADWLEKNSSDFRRAFQTVRERSGKTILHENLCVARVGDLALKVAIEKALGGRVLSLGDEHLAFPKTEINDVKRVVVKAGHVIKEA